MSNLLNTAAAAAPSRRTVAKGAAWAAPAILIGAQAPALAISGACPSLGDANWTETPVNIGNTDSKVNALGGIEFVSDAVPGMKGSDTYSTQLVVQKGRTYHFSFQLQTRFGYSKDFSIKFNTSITITIGGRNIFTGSTQDKSFGTLVTPPTAWNTWGANGNANEYVTASYDYVATADGLLPFAYRFDLAAPTETNNDDWKVVSTLTCV